MWTNAVEKLSPQHICLTHAHTHIDMSSIRGQSVNSSDQRGLLPDEPIDPSAPQRHGEYNWTNSWALHVTAGLGLRAPRHQQDWSALLGGRARAYKPNALSIWALRGCAGRELWTTWEGGSIHFCRACSHSSACICHKLLHGLEHNTCYCVEEVGFYSQFYSRDESATGWWRLHLWSMLSAAPW